METLKSPEHRVLEVLFQKLRNDPNFPKSTLKRLEQTREDGGLAEVKEVLEACHLAGGEDAADIAS